MKTLIIILSILFCSNVMAFDFKTEFENEPIPLIDRDEMRQRWKEEDRMDKMESEIEILNREMDTMDRNSSLPFDNQIPYLLDLDTYEPVNNFNLVK